MTETASLYYHHDLEEELSETEIWLKKKYK